MQQTEKYQFNLIETSDPFSPEPLNQNMEKTEAALTAQAADTAAQFAALPRVHIQNWTGDGTDSRTLTFPFQPEAVLLSPTPGDSYSACLVVYGQTEVHRHDNNFSIYSSAEWNGNTLTLRTSRTEPTAVFNYENYHYTAVAIG